MVTYWEFMYEITDFDLQLLSDNYIYAYKNEYEICRNIQHATLSPYLGKQDRKKKKEELFPLATDMIDINKKSSITNDELEAYKTISGKVKDLEFKEVEFER